MKKKKQSVEIITEIEPEKMAQFAGLKYVRTCLHNLNRI